MITVVDKTNISQFKTEMEDAYRLRHDIFVEEKGWEELRKADKRETDQFDDEHAVHMLFHQEGKVVGYQCMLPTTRPYLLSEVYPQLCDDELPNDTAVWEWTRFAVEKAERKRGMILSPIGNGLLSSLVEWGFANDVHSVVIEMNPVWMLRLLQLNFRVQPLGYIQKIAGEDTLAVKATFNRRTLARLQEVRGNNLPAITSWPGGMVDAGVSRRGAVSR